MYEAGCARLEQSGLHQYEISNFAQFGAESQHNLRYWRRKSYLGLGLDAHSMLHTREGGTVRFSNPHDLTSYMTYMTNRPTGAEMIDPVAQLEEAWFLGLRLNEGVSLKLLRQEFGVQAISAFDDVLTELAADGLLIRADNQVALTLRGRMLSNEVFGRFLGVASSEQSELFSRAR